MGFGVSLHGSNPEPLMSALGQKQTSRPKISISALPPKADIAERDPNVRFVPKADIVQFDFRPAANSAARITVGGLDCLRISSY